MTHPSVRVGVITSDKGYINGICLEVKNRFFHESRNAPVLHQTHLKKVEASS